MRYKLIPAHTPPHTISELLSSACSMLMINGHKDKFQCKIREYLHTDNFYVTNSGRKALYLGLKMLGIGKADEVILPAFTSDIVPLVIRHAGAVPVPVDVNIEDYNLNPDLVLENISPKTKAVLAVHTFGYPSDIDELKDICEDKNLYLIEDAASAFGAKYKGEYVGTFGDFSLFSFGIGKSVSLGGGGGFIFSNKKMSTHTEKLDAKQAESSIKLFIKILGSIYLSNPYLYNLSGNKVKDLIVSKQYSNYEEDIINNKDISRLAYSIGLREIESNIIEKRRTNASYYKKILGDFYVCPPIEDRDKYAVWTRYFSRLESEEKRTKVINKMIQFEVEPLIPDYGYPISQNLYPKRYYEKIPISRILTKTLIGLPITTRIKEETLTSIFST